MIHELTKLGIQFEAKREELIALEIIRLCFWAWIPYENVNEKYLPSSEDLDENI